MRRFISLFIALLGTTVEASADLVLPCGGARVAVVEICSEKAKAKPANEADAAICARNSERGKDIMDRLKIVGHQEVEILDALLMYKERFEKTYGAGDDLNRASTMADQVCGRQE